MREILFRGKNCVTNKWVYGNYCAAEYLNSNGVEHLILEVPRDGTTVRIIPETVGQYTGLTDKNGKKVFEGDILAFSDRLVYVHWHDYCGCWDCSYIKAIDGKPTLHKDRSPNKWRYNAEVIGNIHDNKELLEVK